MTPIREGREAALRATLAAIAAELPPQAPPPGGGRIPFERLTTVHFLRWVMLEAARDAAGAPIPAQLVLATAFDAPLDRHLAELASVARDGLDAVYRHCAGYPDGGAGDADGLSAYLRAHLVLPSAAFIATRWRTVAQIRAESALRAMLEDALDAQLAQPGAPVEPAAIGEALRARVAAAPEWRWGLAPAPGPPLTWWIAHYGRLAALVVGLIAGLPVLAPIALVAILLLRRAERREAHAPAPPPPAAGALARLTDLEDFDVQNQMSLVSVVKPGRLRQLLLRVVLLYARFRVAYLVTQGALVGIPSIHFAHWTLIDGGRRLLFLSNYDGTWESYLGEFIDRAGHGVNAIWSNTLGFPPARFLILDGAGDEQRFKAWVRDQQIPTDVWYAAYPRLSVRHVNNNTALRDGLSAPLAPAPLAAWLRRL
ncbi:MAG: hypothetical protein U0802_11950 [Candidatus Binatia bacterium]